MNGENFYQIVPVGHIQKDFEKCKTNLERMDFIAKKIHLVDRDAPITSLSGKSDEDAVKRRETGNEFYKKKNYYEALEDYTNSVAFAKTKKTLALAYGNRSAALYKLGFYQQCLIDIERALQNDYPPDSKFKLNNRKNAILKSGKPPPIVKKISAVPSDCLTVEEDEKYGRHMVATRDIEIGEVLLVEKPLGAILIQDFTFYCHECLTLCYNPIPCSNCTTALYCSDECLKTSLNNHHKYVCSILELVDPIFVLPLKVTFTAITEMRTKGDSQKYHQLLSLKTHEEHPNRKEWLYTLSITAVSIFMQVKKKTNFFGDFPGCEDTFKELFLHCFLIGQVNGVRINRLEPIEGIYNIVHFGSGFYSKYSLFNHSCCPNVFYYHDGQTLIMRALTTIKKGEQCFISYGKTYTTTSKSERQKQLETYFHFVCTCKACEGNWPEDEGVNLDFVIPLQCVAYARSIYDQKFLLTLAQPFIHRLKQVENDAPTSGLGSLKQLVIDCFQVYETLRMPNAEQ